MALLTGESVEFSGTECEEECRSSDNSAEPLPASCRLEAGAGGKNRWGIILAGGDGTRLRSLTRFIAGDDRPKQFCKVFGRRTLFEQTRQRSARSIPNKQTILALTSSHECFYDADLYGDPAIKLVQPFNRGTAPAIILSLLRIAREAPDALVAVLPSDHYFSSEAVFTSSLESAFETADGRRDSVVLLGARPNGPDVDFGWIDLGAAIGENLFRVRGFEEKPQLCTADRLFRSGALWNTFVMVGNVRTFLWMAFLCEPGLVTSLAEWPAGAVDSDEIDVPASLYEKLPTADFSRQVLSHNAHRLIALRLERMEWHDLGHPDRVFSVLRSHREDVPPWMRAWEAARMSFRNPIRRVEGYMG